jgi:myo-inositol 2-dehydrogenase / D-chiro-inositol 1-dehydrogenase
MLEIALLGAGRIGQIHAANVAAAEGARLRLVYDPDTAASSRVAELHGARVVRDPTEIFNDKEVKAVIIATPTPTHAELIIGAAGAKKAIFCEKPIDLDLVRVDAAIAAVEAARVPFFIGFNRRFDPSFASLEGALRRGEIGKLELLTIISRDPEPPPASYVAVSGGLFRDMMIHDFDMARFLLGEEPSEVFARASCLVDPAIGAAGDVDTAMVVMRTPSGVLCHIQNSRRAVYGYDQRIEAHGALGMLTAGNWRETTVERWTAKAIEADKPLRFFLERYQAAYRLEMTHFVALAGGKQPVPSIGAIDGKKALILAEAAIESVQTGQPVSVASSLCG